MPPKESKKAKELPKPRYFNETFFEHGGPIFYDDQKLTSEQSADLIKYWDRDVVEENKEQWKKDRAEWEKTDPRFLAWKAAQGEGGASKPQKRKHKSAAEKPKGKEVAKAAQDEGGASKLQKRKCESDVEKPKGKEVAKNDTEDDDVNSMASGQANPVAPEQPKEKKSHVVLIIDGDDDEPVVKKEKVEPPKSPLNEPLVVNYKTLSRDIPMGGFPGASGAPKAPKNAPKEAPGLSLEHKIAYEDAVKLFAELSGGVARESRMSAYTKGNEAALVFSDETMRLGLEVQIAFSDYGLYSFRECKACARTIDGGCRFHRDQNTLLQDVTKMLKKLGLVIR